MDDLGGGGFIVGQQNQTPLGTFIFVGGLYLYLWEVYVRKQFAFGEFALKGEINVAS